MTPPAAVLFGNFLAPLVFRIEQEILAVLNDVKHRDMLAVAARLVAERLAPRDAHAAEIFLDEIARGELP
jgi:hypothetical protein